jgi:hypothetical protein
VLSSRDINVSEEPENGAGSWMTKTPSSCGSQFLSYWQIFKMFPTPRWEYNINMGIKETGVGDLNWTDLVQSSVK